VHTDGGILDHVLYDLDVECLPGNIPDGVEIDVSNLALGESVRVGDIPPREGVKFLQDAELPIASVVGSAAAESALGADETPAEPEVLKARKGDED
jgi:large subunit ribosomal protein L25